MGTRVTDRTFTSADRQRYRDKMRRGLDALARMLADGTFFFPHQQMGLEMELCLVDDQLNPSMSNGKVLERINDPVFTTELGQHNIEINLPPRVLAGDGTLELEQELRSAVSGANSKARDVGTKLIQIGILPTLRAVHFDPCWLTDNPRYLALNTQILNAKGEQMPLDITGPPLSGGAQERLFCYADSIAPESAGTSAQLHLQVAPEDFDIRMPARAEIGSVRLDTTWQYTAEESAIPLWSKSFVSVPKT